MTTHAVSFAACAALLFAAAAADAQRVAVFDQVRGGEFSFAAGSRVASPRADILASFPGVTFQPVSTVSLATLADSDLLLLCSATGLASAIQPLDPGEQSALLNFVLSGGGLIGFVDNTSFAGPSSDASNQSLLNVFNVDALGTGPDGLRTATAAFPDLTPVTSGPFGTVPQFTVSTSGWFAAPTTSITVAILADNFQPVLIVFPENVLGPGSGRVVLFADTSLLTPGVYDGAARQLLLNAIDYVRPPASCNTDLNQDGNADQEDITYLVNVIAGGDDPIGIDPDFNRDGNVDQSDIASLIDVVAGGQCP